MPGPKRRPKFEQKISQKAITHAKVRREKEQLRERIASLEKQISPVGRKREHLRNLAALRRRLNYLEIEFLT